MFTTSAAKRRSPCAAADKRRIDHSATARTRVAAGWRTKKRRRRPERRRFSLDGISKDSQCRFRRGLLRRTRSSAATTRKWFAQAGMPVSPFEAKWLRTARAFPCPLRIWRARALSPSTRGISRLPQPFRILEEVEDSASRASAFGALADQYRSVASLRRYSPVSSDAGPIMSKILTIVSFA